MIKSLLKQNQGKIQNTLKIFIIYKCRKFYQHQIIKSLLFIGKKFGIEGFRNETKSKIIDIITCCSGFYLDIIVKSINYVIVPLTFGNIKLVQKKTNFLGIRPNIVNCNWILDNIKEGILLSPAFYKPIKPIDFQIYLSNIFKGQTFCICKITYKKDKIKEIKE